MCCLNFLACDVFLCTWCQQQMVPVVVRCVIPYGDRELDASWGDRRLSLFIRVSLPCHTGTCFTTGLTSYRFVIENGINWCCVLLIVPFVELPPNLWPSLTYDDGNNWKRSKTKEDMNMNVWNDEGHQKPFCATPVKQNLLLEFLSFLLCMGGAFWTNCGSNRPTNQKKDKALSRYVSSSQGFPKFYL